MSDLPASQVIPPSVRKRFEPVGGVSISAVAGQWVAIFADNVDPVVAFDSAGNALVMEALWGSLVRANAYPDFHRIELVDSVNPTAAKSVIGVAA
jgi:hypothetical protein